MKKRSDNIHRYYQGFQIFNEGYNVTLKLPFWTYNLGNNYIDHTHISIFLLSNLFCYGEITSTVTFYSILIYIGYLISSINICSWPFFIIHDERIL